MTGARTVAAVVQQAPVFGDRDATVDAAVAGIAEAASAGAQVVAFAESHVPGYPGWIFGAAGWDDPLAKRLYARWAANSLEVGGPALDRLRRAAREHRITVVMGATERDTRYSRGSLYNSLFFIGDDGDLLGVHRKLMPTHAERMVWAPGDAVGLRVHDTGAGRVGGLICWEHWMPLPRFALHAAGEQIHVAAWPETPEMHQIASRHYAFEARAFVLLAGGLMRVGDLPDDPELREVLTRGLGDLGGGETDILPGGSAIIAPDGSYLAGPAPAEPTVLVAELDLESITGEQLALDTAGHYHRPDIFSVTVDRRARTPIAHVGDAAAVTPPAFPDPTTDPRTGARS